MERGGGILHTHTEHTAHKPHTTSTPHAEGVEIGLDREQQQQERFLDFLFSFSSFFSPYPII
jgi:hypothetical protein